MADWRQKLKTISSADGKSAPEPAKAAGMGCLSVVLAAVFILTLIIAIGLFRSGSPFFGAAAAGFSALVLWTAAAAFPLRRDSL